MNIRKLFIMLIWIYSSSLAQLNFNLQAQLSKNTWSFPLSFQTQINDNGSLFQSYVLTHIDHPADRYKWINYNRSKATFYNDEGYFRYHNEKMKLTIGRKYYPIGVGRMSGLFISPFAPSLDQITLKVRQISKFSLRNSIIRLDNRSKEWGGEKKVAHRWYYLRSIGYNYKDKVKINLIDAVIATGFNRGLEWYYVNPLSSLFMERKHQYHWQEGSDTTTVIGIGDNDNHFVGGNINISIRDWEFYGEVLIDEWQLTVNNRDDIQTVFGILSGFRYSAANYTIIGEYSYASPWLYINRGLYSSLEYHSLPLGMRAPQSQAIDLLIELKLKKGYLLGMQTHLEKRGDQLITTYWDAWDNKIKYYNFKHTLPSEIKITFHNPKGKYFNQIAIYHNWLSYEGTYLTINKIWDISI